ncbi:hypothetical protein CRV24_010460 [Beauveria bassiana]|nr:hypothetical protein CRV24_010460 [Beauveria bassiana]
MPVLPRRSTLFSFFPLHGWPKRFYRSQSLLQPSHTLSHKSLPPPSRFLSALQIYPSGSGSVRFLPPSFGSESSHFQSRPSGTLWIQSSSKSKRISVPLLCGSTLDRFWRWRPASRT